MATFPGWQQTVLKLIGAPVNAKTVAWLSAWQVTEGGTAKNNPLNTTQAATGASDLPGNSDHVKEYPSASIGAAATARTLLNGRYPAIVAALRSGDPAVYVNSDANLGPGGTSYNHVVDELKTWGSKGFASDVGSNQYPQQPGGQQVTGQGTDPFGTTPQGTAGALADATGLSGWVGQLAKWVGGKAAYASLYVGLVLFAIVLALIGILGVLGVHPSAIARRSLPEAAAA